MKRTILLFLATFICGCTMYMADVNKDISADVGEISGRYYVRILRVKGDVKPLEDSASVEMRQKRYDDDVVKQQNAIVDAIRRELAKPPLDRFFQGKSARSREAMPVDIDVQVNWRESKPSGFLMELSNVIAVFSLTAWPAHKKVGDYEIRATVSSDASVNEWETAVMEMTEGVCLTPVVSVGLLASPDYFTLPQVGADDERERKTYQGFLSEQVALMVKSLCAKLPEKYVAWRAHQPWYIEEQERKISEAAYAAFADRGRSAADRLADLKKVTSASILKSHARELSEIFKSETDAALREELFKRIDAATLTTLPYDKLMVTRWREIQTNANLLAAIYTRDYERLMDGDRTELAKRLCACAPVLVEEMINAPTNESYVTNNAAWFTLLCEAPCKTRKVAVLNENLLRRVPAEVCEFVEDYSEGESRIDLKRETAKALLAYKLPRSRFRNGEAHADIFSGDDFIEIMAASPSLTIREVALENIKDFDLILKKIREGGDGGTALAQFLRRKAVSKKDWKVLYSLAQMYEHGLGVTQSAAQAAAYYRMVAENGGDDFVKSWVSLGRLYEEGRGVEPSAEQAATCYLAAAKTGDYAAQIKLADLYVQGRIGEHFLTEKVKWSPDFTAHLLEIDREKYPRIDYLRGILYETKAIAETDDGVLDLFRRAADRGIVEARVRMGEICENGLYCVKPSWSNARNWYKTSGVEGEKRLAAMVAREERRVRPYRDAAERGEAWAMYKLGRLYLTEDGLEDVEQDWDKGIALIRKAAEKGYPNAQFVLGMLCGESGGHLPRDMTEAVKWWRKAADQGFADAEYMLGKAYFEGLGVPKSIPTAIGWWTKAAAQGHEAAVQDLNQVGNNLSNIFDRLNSL